jgi:hypothetical protein
MKKIYYRATSEPFKPDDVMPPGDDHTHSSKQALQLGEKRLRSLRPDLAKLRANSLYLFGDKDRASDTGHSAVEELFTKSKPMKSIGMEFVFGSMRRHLKLQKVCSTSKGGSSLEVQVAPHLFGII